jgi:hypothetical protein
MNSRTFLLALVATCTIGLAMSALALKPKSGANGSDFASNDQSHMEQQARAKTSAGLKAHRWEDNHYSPDHEEEKQADKDGVSPSSPVTQDLDLALGSTAPKQKLSETQLPRALSNKLALNDIDTRFASPPATQVQLAAHNLEARQMAEIEPPAKKNADAPLVPKMESATTAIPSPDQILVTASRSRRTTTIEKMERAARGNRVTISLPASKTK